MPVETRVIRAPEQLQAIASPLRLEILGLFVEAEPLSVADLAERMGRSASSIHYHVRLLLEAGLLVEVGSRPSGSRTEKLYRPIAERFAVARDVDVDSKGGKNPALETMRTAFRMTERDLQAAFSDPEVSTEGPGRTLFGIRAHLRLGPAQLEELNELLVRLEERIAASRHLEPSPEDVFVSLTAALAPLPDRRIPR